jgi:hypothetical protein
MEGWQAPLRVDPVPTLLASDNAALASLVRHDLVGEEAHSPELLWHLPQVEHLLRKQSSNGAWKYPSGGKVRSQEDYDQLETFRILGYLIEQYGLTRHHSAIGQAADFFFSHQTSEGDFRGIYGNQYTPNYSAAIMELLVKAGYENDPRIEAGFRWLLGLRQRDGGWALPLRTVGKIFDRATLQAGPIRPDTTKPSSHLITGVVLRAFAARVAYRRSSEAQAAGAFLASRLFAADTYPDRRAPDFWTRFSYPFWFTDLLSALDSLSQLRFSSADGRIRQALDWFVAHQEDDGLWRLSLVRMTGERDRDAWISLAICRMLRRFSRT